MSRLRVDWPGWGTFRIEPERGPTVAIDPCFSKLLDNPVGTPAHARADVMLITHGHHEHIRDAHRALRQSGAPVLAPPQVIDFLVSRRRVDRRRFVSVEPDQTVELPGVTVTARGFPHLTKHDVKGKLGVLRDNHVRGAIGILGRYGLRVAFSYAVIAGQPDEGPFLAYDLQFHDGPRVFVSCEAFTELLDPALPARWAEGQPIDLALIGLESGQERHASAHTAALGPRLAVGAAVHEPFERFYGKAPVVGERWVEGVSTRRFWEPGSAAEFDLQA